MEAGHQLQTHQDRAGLGQMPGDLVTINGPEGEKEMANEVDSNGKARTTGQYGTLVTMLWGMEGTYIRRAFGTGHFHHLNLFAGLVSVYGLCRVQGKEDCRDHWGKEIGLRQVRGFDI